MLTECPTRSRTLVVDDDEVVRDLLAALLDMQGHEVHVVESGAAALHWLETAPAPNLILTDMQMPGMEGLALVEALREVVEPPTLLLGMSGSRPQQPVLDSLDAFVLKPFGYADLETALGDLRRPERTQELEGEPTQAAAEIARRGRNQTSEDQLIQTPSDLPSGEAIGAGTQAVLDDAIFASLRQNFRTTQLQELYTLTLNDVALRHTRLEGYAATGDLEAAQREAHSIKGLCGMVGARELCALAAAVEAGITLDTSAIHVIPTACARLRRMLDTKFGKPIAPAGEHE